MKLFKSFDFYVDLGWVCVFASAAYALAVTL